MDWLVKGYNDRGAIIDPNRLVFTETARSKELATDAVRRALAEGATEIYLVRKGANKRN